MRFAAAVAIEMVLVIGCGMAAAATAAAAAVLYPGERSNLRVSPHTLTYYTVFKSTRVPPAVF